MAVNAAPSGKAPPAFGDVAVGLGILLGSVMSRRAPWLG
jgi:hypothetical protein